MEIEMVLDKVTSSLIASVIERFEQEDRYRGADNAITNLIQKFPDNTVLEDIILKVCTINQLYSTNIYSVFEISQHILNSKIDSGLRVGDRDIVSKIANRHNIRRRKNNTEMSFYSFATKYCSWHNQSAYPIYDGFIEKTLVAYRIKDNFSSFNKKDLKDFSKFCNVIDDFINYYDLNEYSVKEIDKFLWVYGKDKFPPNYEKSKKK